MGQAFDLEETQLWTLQPCFYIFVRTTLKNTVHTNWFVGVETTIIILLSIWALKRSFLHVEILINICCCIRINEKHSWLSRLLLYVDISICTVQNVTSSSPGLHPTLVISTVHIPRSVSVRSLVIIRLLPPETVRIRKQRLATFQSFLRSVFLVGHTINCYSHKTQIFGVWLIFKEVDIHKIKWGQTREPQWVRYSVQKKGVKKLLSAACPNHISSAHNTHTRDKAQPYLIYSPNN